MPRAVVSVRPLQLAKVGPAEPGLEFLAAAGGTTASSSKGPVGKDKEGRVTDRAL